MKRKREEIETTKDGEHSSNSTVEDRDQDKLTSNSKRQKTEIADILTEFIEIPKKTKKTVTWAKNTKDNENKQSHKLRKKYILAETSFEEAQKHFDNPNITKIREIRDFVCSCLAKKEFKKLKRELNLYSKEDQLKILSINKNMPFNKASHWANLEALHFIMDNLSQEMVLLLNYLWGLRL